MNVTASGIGEFAYCPKKWALAQTYGKIDRAEIERRLARLKSAGQQNAPEYALYERLSAARTRLDAGTAAHSEHAQAATTGRQAASGSYLLVAAAVGIAALALALLFR